LVVPCALSLAQPIIAGRYWMIGAPIIVVFLVFVARSALSGWRVPANRRLHMAACAGVVGLLLAMDGTGFFAARHWVRYLPFWKGTARVAPLLSQCGRGSVHVNMGPLLFAVAAHAPATTFVDVSKPPPGWTDSPDSRCPVLGWAEQIKEGGDFLAAASDRQLADMLRITAPLADITVLRHGRGYVVLRAHG
jgi:hypothetical protein